MMSRFLESTVLLDFEHPKIQALVKNREWNRLSRNEAVLAIYTYVKDEIHFGYNAEDNIPASAVLHDGYGQCNTKGILLMALLRAVGVETRFHGFTIYKELQKGAIPIYLFWLAPERIIHSWVEIYYENEWVNLEGFILDKQYLQQIQSSLSNECDGFIGYGIATKCIQNPGVDFQGTDTYIQSEGIANDYGIYDNPDEFFKDKGINLGGFKKLLFMYGVRHLINLNVSNIRLRGLSPGQVKRANQVSHTVGN